MNTANRMIISLHVSVIILELLVCNKICIVLALYPNSCSRVFELLTRDIGETEAKIDIDGAGAMKPFDVTCSYARKHH